MTLFPPAKYLNAPTLKLTSTDSEKENPKSIKDAKVVKVEKKVIQQEIIE